MPKTKNKTKTKNTETNEEIKKETAVENTEEAETKSPLEQFLDTILHAPREAFTDGKLYDIIAGRANDTETFARMKIALTARASQFGISKQANKLLRLKLAEKAEAEKETQGDKAKTSFGFAPMWINESGAIDEVQFCDDFIRANELQYINGHFYGVDGLLEDDYVKAVIFEEISPYVKQRIDNKVKALFGALKSYTYSPPPRPDENKIHVQNGTLNTKGTFIQQKEFCFTRLNVAYDSRAKKPEKWLDFLNDLLIPEDIITLQEFLGYCLIPTNKGQAMLILTGQGGEGKSRIGVVMKEILGKGMIFGTLQDLEQNRFSVASLEGRLLFCDDDLKTAGLRETGKIKNIVTAENLLEVERKGIQKYEAEIHSRIMVFGNSILESLYDHSDGFYRRQIILKVKPRPDDRADNKNLTAELLKEKTGIFKWCFEGLQRLIKNNFHFTVSSYSKQMFEEMKKDSFNLLHFLEDEQYIKFDTESEITSNDLCALYDMWVIDNSCIKLADRTILAYLKTNANKFKISFDYNVKNNYGKRCRGFKGIKRIAKFYNEHA